MLLHVFILLDIAPIPVFECLLLDVAFRLVAGVMIECTAGILGVGFVSSIAHLLDAKVF